MGIFFFKLSTIILIKLNQYNIVSIDKLKEFTLYYNIKYLNFINKNSIYLVANVY